MKTSEVYQVFLKQCGEYSPDGLWQKFQAHTDIWRPALSDPEAALAILREQFEDNELRESGIAVGEPPDPLVLNPILCRPSSLILALRRMAEDAAFDLVADGRALSTQLPACAGMRDNRMQALAASSGFLAFTFSMEDLAVLRLMGIPAMPANGMEDVSREMFVEVRRLLAMCTEREATEIPSVRAVDQTGDPSTANEPEESDDSVWEESLSNAPLNSTSPYFSEATDLILVGWSPSGVNLQQPDGLMDVMSHFVALEENLGLVMDEVFVWKPSAADLDRLASCLQHGEREDVREAILASMDQSMNFIEQFVRENSSMQIALAHPSHPLDSMQGPSATGFAKKQAWAEYDNVVSAQVTLSLSQLATAVNDPVKRCLIVTAADTTRVVHQQAMSICSKMSRQISGSNLKEIDGISEKDTKCLVDLTNSLINLSKETRQCEKNGMG